MARLDHQTTGNLEQHTLPAGQFLCQGMVQAVQGHQGQQLPRPCNEFGPGRTRPAIERRQGWDHDILQDRHVAKQLGELKRPHHPACRDLMRAEAINALTAQIDRTSVSPVEAGEQVDRGGLPRAIRTDETSDLTWEDR